MIGGVLALTLTSNLRHGFARYLEQSDQVLLEDFSRSWQERIDARIAGGENDPEALRSYMIGELGKERDMRRRKNAERPAGSPPRDVRRDPAVSTPILPRIQIFLPGQSHNLLFGQAGPFGQPPRMEDAQSIRAGDKPLLMITVLRRPPIVLGRDDAFLQERYRTIAIAVLSVILLGFVAAWLLARYVSHWLGGVRDSLSLIAQNRFDAPVPAGATLEQREIARGIEDMAEELRLADAQRRRWVAEISHELRTPITILKGELEALLDGIRANDEQALHSLREETERLSRITEDLHFLAIADLGDIPLFCEELEASAFVQGLAARWDHVARESGLELTLRIPDMQLPVFWDREKMERALDNLLSNSLRYTASPGTVMLSLEARGADILIAVEDSPPGVDPAELGRLFEPLFRSGDSRDRRTGGSGLGLSIAQAIIISHGGTLLAEPSSLGGLRMVATIPVAP